MFNRILIGLSANLLLVPLCSASFAQNAPVNPAQPALARTLHVAPKPLEGLASDAQFRTLAEAANVAGAGDTVVIHSGIYRETVRVTSNGTLQKPIRFVAAPGASVMITGADRLGNWRKEEGADARDNIYSTEWNLPYETLNPPRDNKPLDPRNITMRSEQVFVQDYALTQVTSRAALSRGTFFVDYDNKRLYAWSSDNEKLPDRRVEASVRPLLWQSTGEYVQVRGLRFRYAANPPQKAAAQFHGRGGVTEDCIFERTNSVGASFRAPEQTMRRCTFQENGQLGFGAFTAHNSLMSGCLVRNNNVKNYGRAWEAGGDKIVLCRNFVIENSRFVDNRGTGIWFDIGNENCTVRNSLLANNEDSGIFYEISYGLQLHDNVIIGNGLAQYPGWWGGWSGATLSSSPGGLIERNLFVGNKEGFNFREQTRTTPRLDAPKGAPEVAVWNHDTVVRNNTFALNRDAGVWGWFDTKEESHWPKSLQTPLTQPVADTDRPAEDLAKDYTAKGETDKPKNLSLESLRLTFGNNVYAPGESGLLLRWGTDWAKKSRKYSDIALIGRELGLEKGSVVAPVEFADIGALDLRVPAGSPVLKMGAYPQGEVPGVKLGVLGR